MRPCLEQRSDHGQDQADIAAGSHGYQFADSDDRVAPGTAAVTERNERGKGRLQPPRAERRILARAPAHPRAGSIAQNSQLWSPGGLAAVGQMFTLPECSSPFWIVGSWPTVRSAPWTVDGVRLVRARTFAAALPRPMYRITCPSRTRLHARSQVLAMHRGLMYRIIGHYPMAPWRLSGAENFAASP